MRRILHSTFTLLSLTLVLLFSASCNQDPVGYDIPTTYNFTNVSYSGQTARLDMVGEMTAYMKTANTSGVAVDADVLKDMFANRNNRFSDEALNSTTKQIQNKTFALDTTTFLDWMDNIASASASMVPGAEGTAGVVVSSSDPSKSYLFDENGREMTQYIEKGLMGALMYYQISEVYLGDEKIGSGVDNTIVTEGEGTDMEHHWDEAFGYFGAPIDFPSNTTDARYIAKYCNTVDGQLGLNATIMTAFMTGRAAISNDDMETKDQQVTILRANIEKVFAATAIHYLNGAEDNFADDAVRMHELSEAWAFIYGLRFNSEKTATLTQINDILDALGDDFWTISIADIESARDQLSIIYGLDDVKDAL